MTCRPSGSPRTCIPKSHAAVQGLPAGPNHRQADLTGTFPRFGRLLSSVAQIAERTARPLTMTEHCHAWLALTFLIIALIAAVLVGGIAGFAVEIAKIIFFVAIILFLISAVVALIRGRSPTVP